MKKINRIISKNIWQLFIFLFLFTTPYAAFGLSGIKTPDSDLGSLKKGTWLLGATTTVKTSDSENPSSLFENIAATDRTRYTVNTFGGYFVKDLLLIGGDWEYLFSESNNTFTDSDTIKTSTIKRYNTFGVMMRNYLPIDDSGRFSLFVETGVQFGYGKEVKQDLLENDLDRKVTRNYVLDVGVTPGIMAFIAHGVAVEASVNVLGLTSEWGEYTFNKGERTGHTSSTDLDFTISILSLFLGVTFYF